MYGGHEQVSSKISLAASWPSQSVLVCVCVCVTYEGLLAENYVLIDLGRTLEHHHEKTTSLHLPVGIMVVLQLRYNTPHDSTDLVLCQLAHIFAGTTGWSSIKRSVIKKLTLLSYKNNYVYLATFQ